MSGVGIGQASALWLQDGVEAGDEHVGWDASEKRFVGQSQCLTRRGVRGRSNGSQVGSGCSRHYGSRHALARSVPHNEAHPPITKLVELVEVSSHLPGRLAVGVDLPVR